MIASLHLFGRLMMTAVRSQMQYRGAFLLMALGSFLTTMVQAIGIWALFDRFGNLGVWSVAHVAFLYGTINIVFASVDITARGFDTFGSSLIRTGQFDRVLVRPASTVILVAAREVALNKLGQLLQGILVLIYALIVLEINWTIGRLALYVFAVSSMYAFFYAIQIVRATMSFWTIETLEILNTISHGGMETAQYPMSIYKESFTNFFTYVVPLACVAYFPIVGVLDMPDPLGSTLLTQSLAPLAGFVFFAVCLSFWFFGMKRYQSTGS
ncbi:MAG: ABC-2 family transporter protein [Gammaproteobacteria bacterium]|nr:ABC-2 family transporter protein [Gammaproteobacteria bacterium]